MNLSKFFMMSSLLTLSLFFNSCGEAEKLKQLEAQLESQNRNLLNVQSDLRSEKQKTSKIQSDLQSEKQKRIQIEEAFKQKVEEDNENIEISEIIEDIKPSQNDKVFIREYTYRASEDDSKNSSRKKAIQQLKVILSEEVGTHIESYLNIKKQNINGVAYNSINSEIKSLSSSITKLEVLKEKWDGRNYWIKAKVRINEKRTMKLLLTAIKSKSNEKDIKRLNKILATQKRQLNSQNYQVSQMNKKLVAQEIINEARKNEIEQMKSQLIKYQKQEIKQKEEEIKYSSEIERKKALIQKLNSKTNSKTNEMIRDWLNKKELLCSFNKGTEKRDIMEIVGMKMEEPYCWSHSYYEEVRNSSYKFRFHTSFSKNYIDYRENGEKGIKNDMHHPNYKYRICPNTLLQSELSYNCIYFAFEGDLMASRGGCNSEVYKKVNKNY